MYTYYYTDLLKDVMIVGKNCYKYSAIEDQRLSVKECGLKLLIPAQVITPVDALYEITVNGLWCGKFEFPKNSQLVSGVCHISVTSSSQLNKPVTVQLEHCVNITDKKQAKYLSFVVAKSGPPFNFEYLPGGSFCPGSQYGTIHLKEFSLLGIVLCATVGGATIGGLVGVAVGSAMLFLGGVGLDSAVGGATLGLPGVVLGGVVGGVIGYHYATSKYILITYTCKE